MTTMTRERKDRIRSYATYASTVTSVDALDLVTALDERDRVLGICLETLEKSLAHLEHIIRVTQPYGLPDDSDTPVLAMLEAAIDQAAEVLG